MNVLVLDDAETDLDAMACAANALGHQVDSTTRPEEFRDMARDRSRDIQVVDCRLPGWSGPELVAITGAESRHVPTVFLTNYAPDCERDLADFDPRLISTTVAKPPGPSGEDWQELLGEAIDELASRPSFEDPEPIGVSTSELRSDFFSLPPGEVDSLSEDVRDELEGRVTADLHRPMLSAWDACADDWLMLQRVDDTVMITDRGGDDELPTIDAVHETELDRSSPALIMGRPAVLEETTGGLVDCSPESKNHDWRGYPFVRLIFPDSECDFHLDTGNPISYISREFLAENAELPRVRPKSTIISNLFGREDTVSQLPVDLGLHVSGPDGNVELSVRLQAVKNWHRATMLNPGCSGQRCPGSLHGQCGRRFGLIGRDVLYRHSGGVWHFDPDKGQFYALSG
jgi:CheY-like chemotaxis protein